MRLCVLGAGAIGCALAARLAAMGEDVTLVARGAQRVALLQRDGLICDEAAGRVTGRP